MFRTSFRLSVFQLTRVLEGIHLALSFLLILTVMILLLKKQLQKRDYLLFGGMIFIGFGTDFYATVTFGLLIFLNELFLLIRSRKFLEFILHNLFFTACALFPS